MTPRSYPNPNLLSWRMPPGCQSCNLWFRFSRTVLRCTMCLFWKVRVFNRHYEPSSGSVLYICNHQSFLDPILMTYGLQRPMNYMARESLFRFPVFKQMIVGAYAFPLKRGSADTGAIKEAIRRLKAGAQVVIFAEGTRTVDGHIGRFLPGVAMLGQRFADWIVPVVIDGAYEAWPRTQALPSRGSIVVQYGQAVSSADTKAMSSDQFTSHMRQKLIDIQTDIRSRLGKPTLKYGDDRL